MWNRFVIAMPKGSARFNVVDTVTGRVWAWSLAEHAAEEKCDRLNVRWGSAYHVVRATDAHNRKLRTRRCGAARRVEV